MFTVPNYRSSSDARSRRLFTMPVLLRAMGTIRRIDLRRIGPAVEARVRRELAAGVHGVAVLLSCGSAALGQGCPGDLDRDGIVGQSDFAQLLESWGKCAECESDLTGDGTVDGADLEEMLRVWGACPGPGPDLGRYWEHEDGTITVRGRRYRSRADFVADAGHVIGRCGTQFPFPVGDDGGGIGSEGGIAASMDDCGFDATVPMLEYQPTSASPILCVPVVVHVLRIGPGAAGDIPVDRVVEQISILNQRFAPARIRFQLATADPSGAPTVGVRYYDDVIWHNDAGSYWIDIAWDTSRYLNIYTNSAADCSSPAGCLGYATVPWAHPEGDPEQRVVINWRHFGVSAEDTPYDLGVTCVHEVGHYLGLYHTLTRLVDLDGDGRADLPDDDGVYGCMTEGCYASGDLCCDTNREWTAHTGCEPAPETCGDGPDPIRNYMDYSDDDCMTHFTREQIGRMRCTLSSWRSSLPTACTVPGDLDGDGTVNAADLAILLGVWGACAPGGACPADLNEDGLVDAIDLTYLFNSWPGFALPPRTVPGWATLLEAEPDPAIVTDPALREAILATGLAWRVQDNATGIEMLLVPPGQFDMGCGVASSGCRSNEFPLHPVRLTCAFYIGRYEVTQAQWVDVTGANPSWFTAKNGFPGSDARPVDTVSWEDVQPFLAATGLRLPSEAEWEFACRAGTETSFHGAPGFPGGTNDFNLVDQIAWTAGNSGGQTHPVGQKAPNGLGLHDMAGNVYEWVSDWYSSSYYESSPIANPGGPSSGTQRLLRGGSWYYGAGSSRCSYRYNAAPDYAYPDLGGFRVARTP